MGKIPWIVSLWIFAFSMLVQAQAGFNLKAEPSRLNLEAGSEGTLAISLTPKGGFKGQVSLALLDAKGNPVKGYGLLPTSLNLEGQPLRRSLFLQPPADLKPGTYTLSLVARSGNLRSQASLTLTVREPLGFTLGVPSLQVVTLRPGEAVTVFIPTRFGRTPDYARNRSYGFQIGAQGEVPKGLSLQWENVRGGFQLRLALGWDNYPQPGAYVLPLRAQDYTEFIFSREAGRVIRTTRLLVQVAPPPPFTLDAPQPGSLEVRQGSGQGFLVPITLGQFKGKVNLSLEGLPQGMTLREEKRESKEGRLLIYYRMEASLDAPLGDRTLTIRATDPPGYLRQSRNLTLKVAAPPTFGVNTTEDTIDAFPGDGVCADEKGQCSLRAAIMEANALKAPVVVQLPAGTYTLTRESPTDEQGGDLNITSSLILRGAGQEQTTLDGSGKFRVLRVHKGVRVFVESLTIRGGFYRTSEYRDGGGGVHNDGTLTLTNVTVVGNTTTGWGGGILSRGTLTLNRVLFRENRSERSGGALYNQEGTVEITDSIIAENKAGGCGGGFTFEGGTQTLKQVSVARNESGGGGGGICGDYGRFDFNQGVISENRAGGYGGGISLSRVALGLERATVSNNEAGQDGGGLAYTGDRWNNIVATLNNVTFSSNTTKGSGGGIATFEYKGLLRLNFSTITGNTAGSGGGLSGSVVAKGLILAGNTATSGTGPQCQGDLTSQGYNLIGSIQDCNYTRAEGDIGGQNPQLGPLVESRGVPVHIPQPGSPVLDRVPPEQCTDTEGKRIATDARGVGRPQGRACDIGAVEGGEP